MKLWLMKSEPDVYSIDELAKKKRGTWEGVRNYQARNFMREMSLGDLFLFHHSNAKPTGIVGIGSIVRTAYPDPFQFDPKSEYYDPKSPKGNPRWSAVDIGFVERFAHTVTLETMKADPHLEGMRILMRGSRLSVTPVDQPHFEWVVHLAKGKTRVSESP